MKELLLMSTLCSTVTSIAQAKRRGLTSSAGALGAKAADKKPRYAFGKKSGDGVEAVFVCPKERFETNIPSGQRASDIEPRRKRTGFNKLTAEKTNIFVQSIGYFRALSSMGDIAMKATVFCAGQEQETLTYELVTGNIIVTEDYTTVRGNVLICDWDEPENFETYRDDAGVFLVAVDQYAITGESLAIDKYMAYTCHYITGCECSKAYAIATATARQSFVGKTVALIQGANDSAHFKAVMDHIGGTLLVLVMFWIVAAWIGGFYRHLESSTPENSDNNLLHYTLIRLIIGVPVSLSRRYEYHPRRRRRVPRRAEGHHPEAHRHEFLVWIDVLRFNKTGTLTANQLSIREPYVNEGDDVNWVVSVADIASTHNVRNLSLINKVTIPTLHWYPKARRKLSRNWVTEKYTPFDPVSERITTVCDGLRYVCANGAPKAIPNMSQYSEGEAQKFRDKATESTRCSFRSFGVAVQKKAEPWRLLRHVPHVETAGGGHCQHRCRGSAPGSPGKDVHRRRQRHCQGNLQDACPPR
ncbi:hypothetical protein AnigIFM59636_001688 [Aspergillus niger]|nr:hypothetical protein AnigIFM59636_001688 [Aspergillus niger]